MQMHGSALKADSAVYWINIYSMNTYVLLQFEHKNSITIIVKIVHKATSHR